MQEEARRYRLWLSFVLGTPPLLLPSYHHFFP